MSYNFMTGEDYGQQKKPTLPPPKGMVSEGVGNMFQALREATAIDSQPIVRPERTDEERSRMKERDQGGNGYMDANSFKRGVANSRKQQTNSFDSKYLETVSNKVGFTNIRYVLKRGMIKL